MATASAPSSGTAAPVMISQAERAGEADRCGDRRRGWSRQTGSHLWAEASAARTAKPSRVERGKAGMSRSARMGWASMRPGAASRGRRSVRGAGGPEHRGAVVDHAGGFREARQGCGHGLEGEGYGAERLRYCDCKYNKINKVYRCTARTFHRWGGGGGPLSGMAGEIPTAGGGGY